jgi:hypothetical protein
MKGGNSQPNMKVFIDIPIVSSAYTPSLKKFSLTSLTGFVKQKVRTFWPIQRIRPDRSDIRASQQMNILFLPFPPRRV